MTLIRFRNELPSLFDTLAGRELFESLNSSPEAFTLPAVNIAENEDGFKVEVAAPGLSKEDFKINIADDRLIISSEKEEKSEVKEGNYTRKEFSYGSFQRTFTLPATAASDQINASYKDGVLNIFIPKKEEAKVKPPRSIEIQ